MPKIIMEPGMHLDLFSVVEDGEYLVVRALAGEKGEEINIHIRMKRFIHIIAIFLTLSACQQTVDKKELEKELLDLHQQTIDAHLNKDADFFVKNISDSYMQVHEGEFLYPKKEEILKMFKHYFKNTHFSLYEDISEPIVKVSDDGSLGWTIVQVRVKGEQKTETDTVNQIDNTFAWITLYAQENGQWIRLGEVDNYKIGK